MASNSELKARKSPWERDRVAEREAKREAVLHAAAQAFAESGYFQTSLDDIAVRLGITKPTLYYYAKNKEDLILASASRAQELMLAPIPSDPNAPAIRELLAFLRRYAEVIATDFGRCFTLLSDIDVSEEAGAQIQAKKGLVDKRMRELISRGIEDGSIAPCDVKMTAFMLAGAINGIARWFRDDGPLDASTVGEIFVNQMSAGLVPRL